MAVGNVEQNAVMKRARSAQWVLTYIFLQKTQYVGYMES